MNDYDTFCNIMGLYHQSTTERPSVQYIPILTRTAVRERKREGF